MFKNMCKTAIIGASMLLCGSAAHATVYEVNLYGASAQYNYWLKAGPEFLKQSLGCNVANIYAKQSSDGKHGITVCVGDDGYAGLTKVSGTKGATVNGVDNQTVVVRYSAKASYDGILSVQGIMRAGVSDSDSIAAGCTNGNRLMANEATGSWSLYDDNTPGWTPPKTGSTLGTTCKTVTIGASDVKASTFKQKSSGRTKGNNSSSTSTTNRNFSTTSGAITISDASYNDSQPLVVPFAFFGYNTTDNSFPVDNLTRLQATQVFSQAVTDWNQIVPSLGTTSKKVILCLRHAGSGTHSTLDVGVMRGEAKLPTAENNPLTASYDSSMVPTYFNDGSGDEAYCLNTNGAAAGLPSGTYSAIGYMDADMAVGSETGSSYPNVKRLTYMGASAEKDNIKNGVYDFWSIQNLYWSKSLGSDMTSLINALVGFAGTSSYMTTDRFGATANYWCTSDEMKVTKDTDKQWPYRQ